MNFLRVLKYIFHKNKRKQINSRIMSGNIAGKTFHATNSATLTISNNSEQKKKINEDKIKEIIKSCYDNSKKLFDYIEEHGTSVYKINGADKILKLINEEEGFIFPQTGFKALYLNLILNHKFGLKTDEMFVLRTYNVNSYVISYQFYNWYSFKNKIDGFEVETQKNFKNVFKICSSDEIDDLDVQEILQLKSAIKRDIEAINFVKQMAVENSVSKKNLEKIKQGKTVTI